MCPPDDSGSKSVSMPETPRSRTKSMEDSDAQDRKRPRLEADGSLSADEALTDSGCPDGTINIGSHLTNEYDANVVPTMELPSASQDSPQKLSGMVTINTRPPSSTAVVAPDSSDHVPTPPSPSMEEAFPEDTQLQQEPAKPASVSPAHSRSPEIEVAEPEDIDQEEGFTTWKPATRLTSETDTPISLDSRYVWNTFPDAQFARLHKTEQVVDEFAKNLRSDIPNLKPNNPLAVLTEWLQQLLSRCTELTWDLVADDFMFWNQLPHLVDGLLRRKLDLPSDVDEQLIEQFLLHFTKLAILFVDLDATTLLDNLDPTQNPPLLSQRYLIGINSMLQYRNVPLYQTLHLRRGFDIASFVSRLAFQLTDEPYSIVQKVHNLAQNLASGLQKRPVLGIFYLECLRTVHKIIISLYDRNALPAPDTMVSQRFAEFDKQCLEFCRSFEEILQLSISKQWGWLTIDSSTEVFNLLAVSLQQLCLTDIEYATSLLGEHSLDLESMDRLELAEIAFYDWKLCFCWKSITTGRMELRAQGMELLQTDLIAIYHHFLRRRGSADIPLIQHLVYRLRELKVLQYLVSAESHPQLVSRSGNVIAFLAVSKAYTDEDTDTIWNFLLENRDSRMVSEMFSAMTPLLENMDATNLGYLFTRLFDFPISRLDTRVMEFYSHILRVVNLQHWQTHKQYIPDILQIRLFIHLQRAESASRDIPAENRVALRKWLDLRLSELSDTALTDPDMQEIWEECISDLKEMNDSSSGSIRSIRALTKRDPAKALDLLSEEFDYPGVLVREVIHTLDTSPEHFSDDSFLQHDYLPRIAALMDVLRFVPEKMTPELAELLWTHVFTSRKIGKTPQKYAWDSLSSITELCSSTNPFIELWTTRFFSRLEPEDYHASTLKFAEAFLTYQIQNGAIVPQSRDSILEFPGVDLLWRFILGSPKYTVEMDAINVLITFYLDSRIILQCPTDMIEAIHISLVDRCIDQIINAANNLKSFSEGTMSGDDEPMVLVASEAEVQQQELRFTRSLLFLRQLLNALKSNPRYSPRPTTTRTVPPQFELKGNDIIIKYQVFDGRKNPEISEVPIGDINSAHQLGLILREKSGMQTFTCINRARPVLLLGNHATLRELGINPTAGLFILKPAPGSKDSGGNVSGGSGRRNSSTHIDCQISKNFDQLYGLLDLENHLAAEIFNFLQVFPIQQKIQDLIHQQDNDASAILPLERPYKLLYAANAFYLALEDQSLSTTPDLVFVKHSIDTLLSVCKDHDQFDAGDSIQRLVVANMVDCLLLALRVRAPVEVSSSYSLQTSTIVSYAIKALEASYNFSEAQDYGPASRPLACQSFAVLIEASMHDEQIWNQIQSTIEPTILLSKLLLQASVEIRKGITEVLFGLSGPPSTKIYIKAHSPSTTKSRFSADKVQAMLSKLWPELRSILQETLSTPETAHETFEVAIAFLNAIGNTDDLEGFVEDCTKLLSDYEPVQVVGQSNDDQVVSGLVKLLLSAVDMLKRAGKLPQQKAFLELLVTKYLFPELSDSEAERAVETKLPILKSSIRHDLYALVLLLQADEDDFNNILHHVSEPCGRGIWEPHIQHERYGLRSDAGHAGLRNLSNTCYLNSLFTQLYMNLEFREFLLKVENPQRLVYELRKVFAHMQNSYLKCVDTSGVVESIRTYDNEAIDIAVQMDVDEFYNLLFDRLESQMPSPDTKSRFRSIYGGQLVQQIKSKECDHISERLEPFSAIQCDIRGKGDLEESLRAYVEGEVMQGDNKYSCSGCNRHVEAVKRACLKDVPDHLIFHLKRFDFDINTMTRCKINDEFAFPDTIDMAPYTVESLSSDTQDSPPDMFELVGVLIHSGTAESGHYYSLIRERPSAKEAKDSWLQFNDADVTFFEHDRLREYCFGGTDASALRTPKVWSAYMLFYQRVGSVNKFNDNFALNNLNEPVRLDLPVELGNFIALENELHIRAFCAQDPTHANFIRCLLERMKLGDGSDCSEDHEIENKTMCLALEYLDQTSSRFKELPEVESTCKLLMRQAESCWHCANVILMCLKRSPSSFEESVLRNPQAYVRSAFASLIFFSLKTLCNVNMARHASPTEVTRKQKIYRKALENVIRTMNDQWDRMPLMPRGWNEYFGLLNNIASLGLNEVERVLVYEYLHRCLSLIWIDIPKDPKAIRMEYSALWRWKDKGRVYPYHGLMDLFVTLLQNIEFNAQPGDDHELYGKGFCLTRPEMLLLRPSIGENKQLILQWLHQCLSEGYSYTASVQLVQILAEEEKWSEYACNTIAEGLETDPASLARPFLHATLVFCQCSPEPAMVSHLIKKALEAVETIGDQAGRDNVDFIRRLADLENPALNFTTEDFRDHVINFIPKWAPTLLMYKDALVRGEALQLVQEYILLPLEGDGDEAMENPAKDEVMPHAQQLAFAIHRRVNDLAKTLKIAETRGRRGKISGLHYVEALHVLETIARCLEGFEIDGWKDVLVTTTWLRSFVEDNGSGEEEESEEWTQNPSDSEDPEMMESGSFGELTP